MPYSEVVADMVLPDTPEARQEASNFFEDGFSIYYCGEYAPDDQYGKDAVRGLCINRNPWGDRKHSLCYACMAGYISSSEDDPHSDDLRTGKLLASL